MTLDMEKCARQVFLGHLSRQMKLSQIHAAQQLKVEKAAAYFWGKNLTVVPVKTSH